MSTSFDWSQFEAAESDSSASKSFDWKQFEEAPQEISKSRSVLSAFPKGLLKGTSALGSLHDPITAFFSKKNIPHENEVIEKTLPTRKDEPLEQFLETAGELAPTFALGPENWALKGAQIGLGAATKQALKEAGAPDIVQELGSAIGPLAAQGIRGALSKKLSPNMAQKEVYDFLKGYGFSDKQITPFVQSERKSRWLAKTARGFLDPEKFKEETKSIPELVYASIREKQAQLPPLAGARKTAFFQQLDKQMQKIPYTYTDMISKDLKKLRSSELSFKNLRDFEAALNHKIGSSEGGKEVLGILKEPVNFGERLLSQDLYKEKELMNRAYRSRMNIYDKLPEDAKGSVLEKVSSLGPLGAAAAAYAFGVPFAVKGYVLKKGSELAAAKLLTSPRLQNMQQKLTRAILEENKGSIINLLSKIEDLMAPVITEQPESSE